VLKKHTHAKLCRRNKGHEEAYELCELQLTLTRLLLILRPWSLPESTLKSSAKNYSLGRPVQAIRVLDHRRRTSVHRCFSLQKSINTKKRFIRSYALHSTAICTITYSAWKVCARPNYIMSKFYLFLYYSNGHNVIRTLVRRSSSWSQPILKIHRTKFCQVSNMISSASDFLQIW